MSARAELSGKVALVTGGGRGIGRSIALALAAAGADVAINYVNSKPEAEAVCRQIEGSGRRCLVLQADVATARDVAWMIGRIEVELGAVSVLVNNAGIARPAMMGQLTEESWDETIDVNLKSVFLVTQEVLPNMRANKWGRIISLSSVAAQTGGSIGPHYAASKAGILGLTRYYAAHLANEGITFNAVAPALIDTDMIAGNPRARPDRLPVGRLGTAQEVAGIVLALATNAFITGQTIGINGGMYMS